MQNKNTPRFKPVKKLLAMFLVSCKLQRENPVGRSRSLAGRAECESGTNALPACSNARTFRVEKSWIHCLL